MFLIIYTGLHISQASENVWKVLRVILRTVSKLGTVSLQEYVSIGITLPVFYGVLIYKLRYLKGTTNFISLGSKIVKRLRRWLYEPVILFQLYTDCSWSIALWLTRRWHHIPGIVQTSSEATGFWFPTLLIVSRDSSSPWIWARVVQPF